MSNSFQNTYRKLLTGSLLAIIFSNFSVFAQTRRGVTRKPKTMIAEKEKETCANCWSGVINYEKVLTEEINEDEPVFGTTNPKSERIVKNHSRAFEYTGKLIVDGSSGRPVADTKVSYNYGEIQTDSVTEFTRCRSNENDRLITETNETRINANAEANGSAKFFSFGVSGGIYHFEAGFPDALGKYAMKNSIARKNFCANSTQKPSESREQTRDEKVTGESFSIENKVNPATPNDIAGTKSWEEKPTPNTTVTYTVSWKFKRKAPKLMITEVKFFERLYPSPNTWTQIDADDYTIDGNDVRIIATIANLSGEQKNATVNFKELNANIDLPEGSISADFKPHEERDVEYIWDTSGFSWKEDPTYNEEDINRRIEVKIPDDKDVEPIEVRHKPVILVAGLWTNREKFKKLYDRFTAKNWEVAFAHVYVSKKAAETAPIIDKAVREMQEKENAWHVDLVAHSTGGLGARAYIDSFMPTQFDGRPTATHLIMLGTPNLGTPCAEGMDDIISKIFKRNPEALGEISHKNINAFNQTVNSRHGTKFYAMAGNEISPTCQLEEPGDGVVPFISAVYQSKSHVVTNLSQEDLGGHDTIFAQLRSWLAVPPKGNHAPDNSQAFNDILNNEDFGKSRNYGAMFRPAGLTENSNDNEPAPDFATGVKLAANETKEIEIPVTNGSRLSLILYTSPNISATLIDDKGEIVGKNLIGTPEAGMPFRTITVKKAFPNGKWKLKLESRETTESEIVITAFIDYKAGISARKYTAN